ncbi:hypothetical protein Q428_02205 [Fervidicella metallireducens AeB]|uniref:Spore germination protein n=1 Tax=Fervidicella metallireducens AeB TaxID=1403537 RepID=A0A017RYF0_9CLOT|nr:GerAB/ArcD/ProY family transporter [Fervidicella metallireducens]EYE89434.1 hypothetical protein Q428_02205 [Fervidicella metallireducens AeB]
MDEKNNLYLNDLEVIALLVGNMVGIGILSLPGAVVKDAKQSGWISVIIGGIYPLVFGFLAMYLCRKHSDENILNLSKRYFGNIVGNLLNIIFLSFFAINVIAVVTGFTNVLTVYGTPFLKPLKILLVITITVAYISNLGLKTIGRINKISLFLIIALNLLLLSALRKGNYLNLFPLFGGGMKNIISASKESAFSYGGIEIIFLIYPYIRNKDKLKSIIIKASSITIAIYTWITFATIYYLGHRFILKNIWPVLMLTESIDLPIVNSFRLIFLFLWSIVMLKLIVNNYYSVIFIFKDVFRNKIFKNVHIWFIPVVVFSGVALGNEIQRRELLDFIIPKITIFNLFYVLLIAIMSALKDKNMNKNSGKGIDK